MVKIHSKTNDNLVPLVDIFIEKAKSLGFTSIRKDFWALFDEIKDGIRNGNIEGTIGREVKVNEDSLDEFMKIKRRELNLPENTTADTNKLIEALNKLQESLKKTGLADDEIVMVITHRLGINK